MDRTDEDPISEEGTGGFREKSVLLLLSSVLKIVINSLSSTERFTALTMYTCSYEDLMLKSVGFTFERFLFLAGPEGLQKKLQN
jgi:hypothetical protein